LISGTFNEIGFKPGLSAMELWVMTSTFRVGFLDRRSWGVASEGATPGWGTEPASGFGKGDSNRRSPMKSFLRKPLNAATDVRNFAL